VSGDYPTPGIGLVVTAIQSNRALILCLGEAAEDCLGAWRFILEELDDSTTRLLFRQRAEDTTVFDRIVARLTFLRRSSSFRGGR
jgi:hypothetical protein